MSRDAVKYALSVNPDDSYSELSAKEVMLRAIEPLEPGPSHHRYKGLFAKQRAWLHAVCHRVGEGLIIDYDQNYYHRMIAWNCEDAQAHKERLEDYIVGAKHQDIIDWEGYLRMPTDGPKRLWWNQIVWEQAFQSFYGETSRVHPFTPSVKVHGITRYEPFKDIWRPEDFEHFKTGSSVSTRDIFAGRSALEGQ